MNSRFFTNEDGNTLLTKLAAVFEHHPIAEFDALTAYFRATGYFELRPHLQQVQQIRILVGINVDQWAAFAQKRGLALQFGADPEQAVGDYIGKFKNEIDEAEYDQETELSVQQFVEDITEGKITLRAHPSRRLHAKIYLFRPHPFNQHSGGEVITGSSNLTQAGLGASGIPSNYEFNVSLRDYDDVKFATEEFEKLWVEAVDILPVDVSKAVKQTYLRDDFTPFEIYIKLLIEYFGREIEFDPNSISDLPPGWKHLNYQKDAVEQGLILLQDHNGFFLSDVVGLGKTLIAVMIARKHFYLNGYPEYRSHCLVVCPPAVKTNWLETVAELQLDNVQLITSGSLHKITNPVKYDLIIVDEAHQFRNDTSEAYTQLQRICKSPCRDGSKKRVILVSATPLNNRPDDIRNQLLLFQDANDSTLDVNISRFFSQASKEYKNVINKRTADDYKKRIEHIYTRIRRKVIEPLTVRRTRTDLERHPQYADDLLRQDIVFPKVKRPVSLLYPLNEIINTVYHQSFTRIQNTDGKGINYARYRLIEFLKPEHKGDYQRPEQITAQLAAIMRTLFIKRLDSSFHAFHQSLSRSVRAVESLREMVKANQIFIAPDEDIERYIEEGREDELLEKLLEKQATDPSIKVLTRDDFEPELFELLEQDCNLLQEMQSQWGDIVEHHPDPKFELLLAELPDRLLNKEYNPDRKLVVFSEAADTTDYLSKNLHANGYRVLAVNSLNRAQRQDIVRQNFDANLPLAKQKDDFDILISTESLAEGVDLHRANTIVNYDTPWNSTRLMQRIGRINRIGSRHGSINIFNFFPTEQVEDDIALQQRAQIKLQAFHTALGEDSQIYTQDEKVTSFGLFDQDVTEDQEISERLTYLMEIRNFRDENPDEFKRIKNLPLKIRNVVEDEQMNGCTICYLRNRSYSAFYQIHPHGDLDEMGFLEAVQVFKKHLNKEAVKPLPDFHYEHVQRALAHFEEQLQDKIIKEIQAPELSPQQSTSIHYLSNLLKLEITDTNEKQSIQLAIEWIKLGRFQNLPRDVFKLYRSQKRNPVVIAKQLEAVMKIIASHATDTVVAEVEKPHTESQAIQPPKVVISQGYIAK